MAQFVKMDSREIAQLLRGPDGEVARYVIKKATRLQSLAKIQVGKDTRKLEHSIVKRFIIESTGPAVQVGSEEPHAGVHHKGSEPHDIFPRRKRALAFFWKAKGKVVILRRVRHPGTKPNHYLTDPLQQVMREDTA